MLRSFYVWFTWCFIGVSRLEAGETFEMINSKLGAEPDCFSTPNGALGAILRGG
jgi:hypothetical protein